MTTTTSPNTQRHTHLSRLLALLAFGFIAVLVWVTPHITFTPDSPASAPPPPPVYDPPRFPHVVLAQAEIPDSPPPPWRFAESMWIPESTAMEADVDAVARVLQDTQGRDMVRHEAAEWLRHRGYPHLLRDLLSVIGNPAEPGTRFRSWAVQHAFRAYETATEDERVAVRPRFRAWLEDADMEVRREALLGLSRLGDPVARTVAATWLENGAEGMDLAIRILRENDAREEIERIRAQIFSGDVPTRMAALLTLSEWGDEESRAAMEEASTLPDTPANFRLRRGGHLALLRLDASSPVAGKGKPPHAPRRPDRKPQTTDPDHAVFRQGVSSRRIQAIHPSTRTGSSVWFIRPYTPNIHVRLEMAGHRSTFGGGDTEIEFNTSDPDVERVPDRATGGMVGIYRFDIEIPDGEAGYGYRIRTQRMNASGEGAVPELVLVNGHAPGLGLTPERTGIPPLDNPGGKICLNAQETFKRAVWRVEADDGLTVKVFQDEPTGARVTLLPGKDAVPLDRLADGDSFIVVGGEDVGFYTLTAAAEYQDETVFAHAGSVVFKFATITNQTKFVGCSVDSVSPLKSVGHRQSESSGSEIIGSNETWHAAYDSRQGRERAYARRFVHGQTHADHVDDAFVKFGAGNKIKDFYAARLIASTGRGDGWPTDEALEKIEIYNSGARQELFTIPAFAFDGGTVQASFDISMENTVTYVLNGINTHHEDSLQLTYRSKTFQLRTSAGGFAGQTLAFGIPSNPTFTHTRSEWTTFKAKGTLRPRQENGQRTLSLSATTESYTRTFEPKTPVRFKMRYSGTLAVTARHDTVGHAYFSHAEINPFRPPSITLNSIWIVTPHPKIRDGGM